MTTTDLLIPTHPGYTVCPKCQEKIPSAFSIKHKKLCKANKKEKKMVFIVF